MFKNQQNQILDKYFCMLSTLNDLLFRVWLEFCCIRLPVISFGRLFPVNFLKTEKPGIGKIFSKWNWIKGDISCGSVIALHLFFMTCFFPQVRPSTLMSIFWREPRVSQDSLETPEFLEETDYLDLKETEVKNIDISAIQQKKIVFRVLYTVWLFHSNSVREFFLSLLHNKTLLHAVKALHMAVYSI